MTYPIETTINNLNITISKGVKYWDCIISDSDWNDVNYKEGFDCKETALEWAKEQANAQ